MYKYSLPREFANNNNNTKNNYMNYGLYDEVLLKKEYYPYQLNTWTTNRLYGTIDQDSNVIIPIENFITNLPLFGQNNTSISNFDFVVEAFKEFKKYYSKFSINNKLAKNYNNIVNLNIKQGYKSYTDKFKNIFAKQFDYFSNSFIQKDKIKSFDDFIQNFVEFVEMTTLTDIPMTQTGFMLSKFGDILNSGLVFSFEDEFVDHNELNRKYINYINDENFHVLLETAARFGFIIDKSAPWRIVADLSSSNMISFMQQFGISNQKDFFSRRTIKLKYSDVDTLKKIILSFYNAFTLENDTITTVLKDNKACNSKNYNFINIINTREQKTIRILNDKYDDSYFIRLYIFVKFKELKLQLNQFEFDKIVKNCQKINKYQSLEAAMNYLDEFVRPTQTSYSLPLTSDQEIGKILSTLKKDQIRPTFKF